MAACLLGALAAAPALAHGGQYRGPGNVVPPGNTGSSGNAFRGPGDVKGGGGAAGPAGPTGSSGSGATNVLAPRTARASGGTPRGYAVGDDLGRWEFWWEFGKDPYLRLRDAIYQNRNNDPGNALWNPRLSSTTRDIQRPTAQDLRAVAAQVSATLSAAEDRDTASACLIALAKIGPQRAGFELAPHFEAFLSRGDQELRETSALAYGIAGSANIDTVTLLSDLIADTGVGQKLSGGVPVNERTRAFAAYAAGLLLRRSRDAGASMRLVRPLQLILAQPERHGRNLLVAAIEALALFPGDWQSKAAVTLRSGIVADLGRYYERELGAGEQLVQAHVPTAIARLVPPQAAAAAKWRERFETDLRGGLRQSGIARASKVNHHVAQSCALALGSLCQPWNDDNSDSAAVGELLIQVHRDHRDQQTRSFAALALAHLGGMQVQRFLLARLNAGNKAIEQPWLAVSLGVLAARKRSATATATMADVDADIEVALLAAFRDARNPSTIGALAIALGMSGSTAARDALRASLTKHRKRDAIAGYTALALGLLQDGRATPDLRTLRRDSVRRPFVLLQSVRALGLIGDHSITEELSAELAGPNPSLVRLSATSAALGQIGDRRSLAPLQQLLDNRDVTPLTRAFAAVALGSICDKDTIPWNAAYATQINYRAATETLTDGAAGILDLL